MLERAFLGLERKGRTLEGGCFLGAVTMTKGVFVFSP